MVYKFKAEVHTMETAFHLNWTRESSTSNIDADLGTPVPGLQLEVALMGLLPAQHPGRNWGGVQLKDVQQSTSLPDWAQRNIHNFFGGTPTPFQLTQVESFCDRVRDKAGNVKQAQLFLPHFSRREWSERFSVLAQTTFEMRDGNVVATGSNPYSVREIALRVAAGVLVKPSAVCPLSFETRLPLVAPWRDRLLERYGFDVPGDAPPLSRFTLQSSGEELAAWVNAPRDRHSHYYPIFSRMALTIQFALRRWTLAAYAQGTDPLADFATGADVLAYSAVRPHAERRAKDFSYDVLNAKMMEYAFGRAARRLEPMIETAYNQLMLGGRESEARSYLRKDVRIHSVRLAQRARKRNRVRALLVSEGVLIYSLMKFARALKSLESGRAVMEAADELAATFNERIGKIFYFLPKTEQLATMLFLEASNSLHCAMGGTQTLRVACETQDGRRHAAHRPIEECYPPL